MTDLEPDLKAQVLEFIWDKRWVNYRRIAREFFADDLGAAGFYLDQLKSEGEICDVTKDSGQVCWLPTAEATSGPIVPIRWRQYADGKTYTLAEDEIQGKYGISLSQFRRRLVFACNTPRWQGSSRMENGALHFRIQRQP